MRPLLLATAVNSLSPSPLTRSYLLLAAAEICFGRMSSNRCCQGDREHSISPLPVHCPSFPMEALKLGLQPRSWTGISGCISRCASSATVFARLYFLPSI
ncbi:unnamed protein product [Urochloa humidicola]